MLSRIGNYLFWLGRYIERAEHISRYARVQYIASVDMPMARRREFAMESILMMAGFNDKDIPALVEGPGCEQRVFSQLFLNPKESISIISTVTSVRENARGARDALSSELWESINKFYHAIRQYPADQFSAEGPFTLSRHVDDYSAVIKGYIDNSLLHDNGWALVSLGLHMERAVQILRILISKNSDLDRLQQSDLPGAIISSQVSSLLRSAEAFDMSRRYYRTLPTLIDAFDFLLLHDSFPKSIQFNLTHASVLLKKLGMGNTTDRRSPEFMLSRLATRFEHSTTDDFREDPGAFCEENLKAVLEICGQIEMTYLKF